MLKSYKNERAFFYLSTFFVALTLLSGSLLSSSRASADDSIIDDVSIRVQLSCTMSGSGMNSHTATINPGTYQTDIGKTTLQVFCNDSGGFAIYAIGYTGNAYTGADHTKLIGDITNEKIATGTATGSNSNDPSNWAMKLVKVTNTSGQDPVTYNPENLTIENGYGNYSVIPDTYTKVASYSSTTDFTLGSKLETTYAAFIASTQTTDVYNGKVKYTLVHPATNVPNEEKACSAGKICYWPNAGNTVVDSMGDQEYTGYTSTVSNFTTPISNGGEATLWASNYKRNNYGFVGWSDKFDWELNANDANGNGTGANAGYHIYGPNATITLPSDVETNGLSLYAVWVKSAGYLQDFTCSTSTPIGEVTALTDRRDNDTYAIAKLADGKCWMIENLRLDYDANFDESLSQGFGKSTTYGNFIGLAEPETANFTTTTGATDATTANSIYYAGTQSGTATIDISQTDYAGSRTPRYRNDNTNTNSTINPNITETNMTSPNANIYSYGNYYNWSAAIANTIYYSNLTATDADGKTSETVNTSLCPAGWHLPTGTGSGEFGLLSNSLGGYKDENEVAQSMGSSTTPTGSEISKIARNYPSNFIYSGYISSSSINNRGRTSRYWSSSAANPANGQAPTLSYFLHYSNSLYYPGTQGLSRALGQTIRCIASSNIN